jgi:hypothetical protein
MPRFLIEVPHEKTTLACNQAIDAFLRTGSHFLTHADWGCKDGEHAAWLIVDVETKDEARAIVPADFRPNARIVRLNYFTPADMDRARAAHKL